MCRNLNGKPPKIWPESERSPARPYPNEAAASAAPAPQPQAAGHTVWGPTGPSWPRLPRDSGFRPPGLRTVGAQAASDMAPETPMRAPVVSLPRGGRGYLTSLGQHLCLSNSGPTMDDHHGRHPAEAPLSHPPGHTHLPDCSHAPSGAAQEDRVGTRHIDNTGVAEPVVVQRVELTRLGCDRPDGVASPEVSSERSAPTLALRGCLSHLRLETIGGLGSRPL